MKKILLVIAISSLQLSGSTDKVYICKSKNATRYHKNQFCRGLSNCKHERAAVTIKEARDRGLTLCKLEQ
jgi:hypothetical protein